MQHHNTIIESMPITWYANCLAYNVMSYINQGGNMQHEWKQVPSVMTGGKPYFYVRRSIVGMLRIVWNRQIKAWVGEYEGPLYTRDAMGPFKSANAGKLHLDRVYA